MPDISIIIPIFNEAEILKTSLGELQETLNGLPETSWEIILADSGSSDGSPAIAKEMAKTFQWKTCRLEGQNPSVGKAVNCGLQIATGRMILILPADTRLPRDSFIAFLEELKKGATAGGFAKSYRPAKWILLPYQWGQNLIRLRLLKHTVWTNGIFFLRSLPITLPQNGFLEDVILSDRLRKEPSWRAVPAAIEVSARRYYPNRPLRRMALNGLIMFLFRLGLSKPEKLKGLYLSLK